MSLKAIAYSSFKALLTAVRLFDLRLTDSDYLTSSRSVVSISSVTSNRLLENFTYAPFKALEKDDFC